MGLIVREESSYFRFRKGASVRYNKQLLLLKKATKQMKGTHKVKRFQSPFLPSQNDRPSPMETSESTSTTSDHLPPEVARMRALHHIQDAAEIISDAMPYVTVVEQQLYASIVDGLSSLERHLADLNKS